MKLLSVRGWVLASVIMIVGSITTVAQSRIQLVQGKRTVKEKVNFIVEVAHEKNQNPRYATAPEDIQVFTRFADRPATGILYLDGKPLGRFDESMQFNSNMFDITYGRHTLTLAFASPAVITDFYVTVRGGLPHEILEDSEAEASLPTSLETRVVELERKVHELEAEIATLKKKRNH